MPGICSFKCDEALTDITEHHGEEDESVSGPQQHDGQEHPKVENLEDLGLGKRQDEDASELC